MNIKQLQLLKNLLEQMPEKADMKFKYGINKNLKVVKGLLEAI